MFEAKVVTSEDTVLYFILYIFRDIMIKRLVYVTYAKGRVGSQTTIATIFLEKFMERDRSWNRKTD